MQKFKQLVEVSIWAHDFVEAIVIRDKALKRLVNTRDGTGVGYTTAGPIQCADGDPHEPTIENEGIMTGFW